MASWLAKPAVQRAVRRPPRLSRTRALDDARFMPAWRHAQRHLRAHYQHGGRAPALDAVVALGIGRDPTVALGLALSGAKRVIAFDVAASLAPDRIVSTLVTYRRLAADGRLPVLESDACARIDEVLRCGRSRSSAWLLEAFGVFVRRADARRSALPSESVDLFVSSNAIARAPSDVLRGIFREFRRLAHEGSVMSHVVDTARGATVLDYRAVHRDARWLVLEEDLRSSSDLDPRSTAAVITSCPAPARTH